MPAGGVAASRFFRCDFPFKLGQLDRNENNSSSASILKILSEGDTR
jgi:hypothetical protein